MRLSVHDCFILLIASGLCAGSLALCRPAQAVTEKEVDNLVLIYREGKYNAAEALAKVLLEQDPTNLRVHYYLGNCCVKLLKIDEAEEQYAICVESGKGTKIADLSQVGLQRLDEIRNPSTLPSSTRRLLAMGGDLHLLHNRLRKQTELGRAQALADADAAKRRVREQFGSHFLDGSGDISPEEALELSKIEAAYNKRLSDLSSHELTILSQATAGNQRTRLVPLGSSLYVQNFVNFGDDNIEEIPLYPPMKATARRLSDPLVKKSSKVTRSLQASKKTEVAESEQK